MLWVRRGRAGRLGCRGQAARWRCHACPVGALQPGALRDGGQRARAVAPPRSLAGTPRAPLARSAQAILGACDVSAAVGTAAPSRHRCGAIRLACGSWEAGHSCCCD
ncbi:hypothetical protein PsYK624_120200 [Phanerochaete sordida]|uniref:Uncharacterized protein n=1 Tax=Phanerochaete sordida TaxID=48140 RepID=A0A9P3LHZ1_9APHY|nr:hypothetical protein PsYK624_120200 [Phanerochaete sordida]